MCPNVKDSPSVNVVSGVSQGSVVGLLLFILYTSKLFHIVGRYIVYYADDTTIYAVILRPLSGSQLMEWLNEDFIAAINSLCLKWHLRLNPKKTKSMVVSRSRTIAPCYGNLTLDGAELEELTSLHIPGVTLDSKLTFETHLREVVSMAGRCLGLLRPAGKFCDCSRVPKSCFNVYVLPSLEYCASCGCRLIWVCWKVLFAVRKGFVRVSFVVRAHRRKVSALYVFAL